MSSEHPKIKLITIIMSGESPGIVPMFTVIIFRTVIVQRYDNLQDCHNIVETVVL